MLRCWTEFQAYFNYITFLNEVYQDLSIFNQIISGIIRNRRFIFFEDRLDEQ